MEEYCKNCGCPVMPGEYGLCPDCRRLPILHFTNKCTLDGQICDRVSKLGVTSDLCDDCQKAKEYEARNVVY